MKRTKTLDRGPPAGMTGNQVYASEQISENMHLLPNGNLLCLNVPVARTGYLVYGPGEVPVKPGPSGVAYVHRTADALFADSALASLNGLAVTNDHPPVDVTPDNWKQFAGGYSLNARRGTGPDADVALVDLILTDRSLIADVRAGKREVSWGYDADYADLGNGQGDQLNMIGNHIALVERGRCGPRCAIGDSEYQPPRKEAKVATRTKIRAPRKTLDAAALAALEEQRDALQRQIDGDDEDGGDDRDVHVHIHNGGDPQRASTVDKAVEDRFQALEAGQAQILETLKALVPAKTADGKAKAGDPTNPPDDGEEGDGEEGDGEEGDGEEGDGEEGDGEEGDGEEGTKAKTTDSAALETGYKELMAQAEILVPGFKVPTFDAALKRHATVDRMCNVRRQVLTQYAADAAKGVILTGINDGKPFDALTMDCAATAALFKTAAIAQGALNNATSTRDASRAPEQQATAPSGVKTLAQINAENAKFWEGK